MILVTFGSKYKDVVVAGVFDDLKAVHKCLETKEVESFDDQMKIQAIVDFSPNTLFVL